MQNLRDLLIAESAIQARRLAECRETMDTSATGQLKRRLDRAEGQLEAAQARMADLVGALAFTVSLNATGKHGEAMEVAQWAMRGEPWMEALERE